MMNFDLIDNMTNAAVFIEGNRLNKIAPDYSGAIYPLIERFLFSKFWYSCSF